MKKLAAITRFPRPSPAAKAKVRLEPVRDAERTQQAILAAAEEEFASKGLAGARVDAIAEQSGANKRMLYYYFGSKEQLYLAVLERSYGAMRQAERELNLLDLEPLDAIRRLIEFKFDYYREHPRLIRLLAGENMLDASFLEASHQLREVHASLGEILEAVLAAGERQNVVKPGVDPVHLYISITALSYFYFANSATLSVAFSRDLTRTDEINARRAHAVQVMLDHVRAQGRAT
jgi:TetR/AcrR family transcriptional regulator